MGRYDQAGLGLAQGARNMLSGFSTAAGIYTRGAERQEDLNLSRDMMRMQIDAGTKVLPGIPQFMSGVTPTGGTIPTGPGGPAQDLNFANRQGGQGLGQLGATALQGPGQGQTQYTGPVLGPPRQEYDDQALSDLNRNLMENRKQQVIKKADIADVANGAFKSNKDFQLKNKIKDISTTALLQAEQGNFSAVMLLSKAATIEEAIQEVAANLREVQNELPGLAKEMDAWNDRTQELGIPFHRSEAELSAFINKNAQTAKFPTRRPSSRLSLPSTGY